MKNKLLNIFLIIILLFCCCKKHDNKVYIYDDPLVSPSGKYILEILNGYNGIVHYKRFNISSIEDRSNPKVIYCSTDTYRINDKLYFAWDDNEDIVWVYSSDIGTFYWSRVDENEWCKQEKGSKEYPNSLKRYLDTAETQRIQGDFRDH